MYWLYQAAPLDSWRFTAAVTAENTVDVAATSKPFDGRPKTPEMELTLLLSPKMFDLTKPMKVTHGNEVLFEGAVAPSLWAVLTSIARRNDREEWFESAVTVKVPRRMWRDFWETGTGK